MVDCRSLIEFCRSFEHHRSRSISPGGARRSKSPNPLSHPFCDHSPFAAVDAVLLLLVLTALAVLAAPYFKFVVHEASDLIPAAFSLLGDAFHHTLLVYGTGMALMLGSVFAAWEIVGCQARKCGNPYCKGLRKAVGFDIQLESEECLKYLTPASQGLVGARQLELGQDQKELEAELKKMAPLNGRSVLIFRARCGCPAVMVNDGRSLADDDPWISCKLEVCYSNADDGPWISCKLEESRRGGYAAKY